MLCVSIGRGRHKQMIAEHQHLVHQGAQLVELRLDYIRRDVSISRLLKDRPCPVIISCRRQQDGGRWMNGEQARLILLRSAIAEGADYVDLEEDIAPQVPRYGKTKRIISYHNFQELPQDLEALHERMTKLDPDVVKIAVMANHPSDNVRMLQLMKNASVPTIGICMGDIGIPTRILAGKFGAPFTFATFHHERSLAPGQLSFRQMVEVYGYHRITKETEVYGVVADPIGHSLSPLIHNAAFQELKLDKVYVPFRVPEGELDLFLDDCKKLDVRGLSVTIPHKEAAMKGLTSIETAARDIGAVNTILFEDDGRRGYNTDFHAAMESIMKGIGDAESENPIGGRIALILGSGGVARAIAYGLKQREADVVISNRTDSRAKQLAQQVGCRWVDWNARHSTKAHLLVNCTPVGMHPNVDESPFHKHYMRRQMVVFDTVYNPEQTLLIKEARTQGCRTVTGVDMFVRQAAMQFKLFTSHSPPIAMMLEKVRRAIGAARYSREGADTEEAAEPKSDSAS
jgi:3-dehydroquinate dehydratase / shikimate dehydrogenase